MHGPGRPAGGDRMHLHLEEAAARGGGDAADDGQERRVIAFGDRFGVVIVVVGGGCKMSGGDGDGGPVGRLQVESVKRPRRGGILAHRQKSLASIETHPSLLPLAGVYLKHFDRSLDEIIAAASAAEDAVVGLTSTLPIAFRRRRQELIKLVAVDAGRHRRRRLDATLFAGHLRGTSAVGDQSAAVAPQDVGAESRGAQTNGAFRRPRQQEGGKLVIGGPAI